MVTILSRYLVWILSAEYNINNETFSENIGVAPDFKTAENWIDTIISDGYDKIENFECYSIIGYEFGEIHDGSFTFRRYNVNGKLIPERSTF